MGRSSKNRRRASARKAAGKKSYRRLSGRMGRPLQGLLIWTAGVIVVAVVVMAVWLAIAILTRPAREPVSAADTEVGPPGKPAIESPFGGAMFPLSS